MDNVIVCFVEGRDKGKVTGSIFMISRRRKDKFIDWLQDIFDPLLMNQGSQGTEIRANCPFCADPDTKQHLYISTVKQAAHCFRCEWAGSWIDLIMSVEGCSYAAAALTLAGVPDINEFEGILGMMDTEPIQVEEPVSRSESVPEGFIPIHSESQEPLARIALRYLQRREVMSEAIQAGMFGVIPGHIKLFIRASDSYWQARSLDGAKPKYTNPALPFLDILGVWDYTPIGQVRSLPGPLFVCEGVFSALAVCKRGSPAVALLGKQANREQVDRLCRAGRSLIILLDSDAHEQAWELADQLVVNGRADVLVGLLPTGDPADGFDFEVYQGDWRGKVRYKVS